MTDLASKLEAACEIGERWIRSRAAAARTINKRDKYRRKLLSELHALDNDLKVLGETRGKKILTAKFGPLPTFTSRPMLLLKLICPELDSKTCSKYAKLTKRLRNKPPNQTIKSFFRTSGGISAKKK